MREVPRMLLLGLGLLLGVGAPADVHAQVSGQVVVWGFRGPRSTNVRRSLIRDFERNGVIVMDDAIVTDARDRLGLGRTLDAQEAVTLARELGAIAVVEGRVRRRRRRWRASVRVRNGFDGEVLGTAGWGGRTARSLRAVGRSAYRRLSEHLMMARPPGPQRPVQATASPTPTGEVPWWQRQDADPTPRDDEEVPGDEEPEDEDDGEPREASTRYDAFRVTLGGGTLFRSMSTMVRVYAAQRGLNPAVPEVETIDEERSYQSGGIGHFELGGRAELYPGAFDEAQSFPYLGALVAFSHSVGVQSNGVNRATGEPVAVGTDQLEFLLAARFRYRFGEARREPELHVDAGWGAFQFNLSTTDLQLIELQTILPPMQHGYLHLAAGLSYGVAPPYLTLGVEILGRIGTNLGADTRNVWGTSTAPSNGFGLGAEAKIDIAEGFFVAVHLQYFMFSTDFSGQVGCAVEMECDAYMDPWNDTRLWEVWPVTPPMGGPPDLNAVEGGPLTPVLDNYVRLRLEVGWAYW